MNIQRRPYVAATYVRPSSAAPAVAPPAAPKPAPRPVVAAPAPKGDHKLLGGILGGLGGAVAGAAGGFGTLMLLSAEGATGLNIGIAVAVGGGILAGGAALGRWIGSKL